MESTDIFYSALLASGVQVVAQPIPGVQSAAIGIVVGAGARDEHAGNYGVSHFIEQMLFRGTQHRDARALSESLDSLGVSYDSSAGLEMSMVSAVLLGDKVLPALDLLMDVVRYPAFPAEAMDSVRALLVQEIRQREDQPAQKTMDVLRQHFFQGSPLGNDVLGSEDAIMAMSRDELAAFWREHFTANNILISIAGNIDWPATAEHLERLTAGWPEGKGRMLMHEPTPHTGVTVLERDASQENIGFAFPGVPVGDDHYYAAALFSQALGGSSNSRLFQEVREKRGLAYAVQSRFDGLEKTGFFRIYVGTSVERAHESIEVIVDELRKVQSGGLTLDELNLSKTRLKSQMIMRSESTAARMVANMRTWFYEQRLRGLDEVKDRIDRVTVDEVGNLIQALDITGNLAAAAIGPRSEQDLFGHVLAGS